jgi:hypothetical protein
MVADVRWTPMVLRFIFDERKEREKRIMKSFPAEPDLL